MIQENKDRNPWSVTVMLSAVDGVAQHDPGEQGWKRRADGRVQLWRSSMDVAQHDPETRIETGPGVPVPPPALNGRTSMIRSRGSKLRE